MKVCRNGNFWMLPSKIVITESKEAFSTSQMERESTSPAENLKLITTQLIKVVLRT